MNRFIETNLLRKGFVALMLVFASTMAYSQCAPQVVRADGTKSTSGVFCEGQLITFEANSPGYTTTIAWGFGDGPPAGASAAQNPVYSYATAGKYTVSFSGTGFAGQCDKTIEIDIKPAPNVFVRRTNDTIQCYKNNLFCFIDSTTAPLGKVLSQRYVTSDGQDTTILNPTFPYEYCIHFADPLGGKYDIVIESLDTSGCLTRVEYKDYFEVSPKIGASYLNLTPPPNPGCLQTLGVFQNTSSVPFGLVQSFQWQWGNGLQVSGTNSTNTQWWNGAPGTNSVSHLYTQPGSFRPVLIVSAYNCSDTFVSQVPVTNIVLTPKINATEQSCSPYRPIFTVSGLNGAPVSSFLWNYGQPPWGPANVNNQNLTPAVPQNSYGPGVYMISLRVISGPCDVTVYDTIQVIGPGTAIEAPGNRVPIPQTYQCIIEDTVCMTNASTFYQNDYDRTDEDSTVNYPSYSFDRIFDITTGQYTWRYREWNETPYGNEIVSEITYGANDVITQQGYTVSWDAAKDSIKVVNGGVTTYHKETVLGDLTGNSVRFGLGNRIRYVFNYIPPPNGRGVGVGNQVAVALANPTLPNRDYRPNIWRVWSMGDNYAPQCTTDSRPWVNQNVGINCNFSVDSAPCHWYTPWDEIYRSFQDGRNYTQPYQESRVYKNLKECYQVNIYAADTMITPGDTVITVPIDSSFTYRGVFIPAGVTYPNNKLGNWVIRRPPSIFYGAQLRYDATLDTFFAVVNNKDTLGFSADSLGRNNPIAGNGSTKWTVTNWEMLFDIPVGTNVPILKLEVPIGTPNDGIPVGSTGLIPGPQTTVAITPNVQFCVASGDSIFTRTSVIEEEPDTAYAQPSTIVTEEEQFGILTRVEKSVIFIDSAAHRSNWFLDNANCNQVILFQEDTIHPLNCKSQSTKQLALTPPSATGLLQTAGTPCPFDGNRDYFLEFSIANSKPGCTQSWFAINYDTFSLDPSLSSSWTVFNSGALLAPPFPGSPIPFILPYNIVGNTGTAFGRTYNSLQIGNPYKRDPIGSFAIGVIVGQGPAVTVPNPVLGQPPIVISPAECLDTMYYPDFFRILPLDANFTIAYPYPDADGKYTICPGDTAWFKFNVEVQDSVADMRWNWGYPSVDAPFGKAPSAAYYFEDFVYYQKYEGPVPGRNDSDIVWNGEDWLYNGVYRTNSYSIGLEGQAAKTQTDTIEFIITSIIKDWKIVADKTNDDATQFITDLFQQSLGLDYASIPAEDVAFYLGPNGTTCVDTTGFSDRFTFGIQVYSDKTGEPGVFRNIDSSKIYRIDTTVIPFDTIETQHILHFRDSSIMGFDSLMIDTNGNGQIDTLTGLYRHVYKFRQLKVSNECNPNDYDTVWINANGPMAPNTFLNSTVGCQAQGVPQYLNVGFINEFSLVNENICNGLEVEVDNYIRYYQNGIEDLNTYPINTFPFWRDADRYAASPQKETFRADWDASDDKFDSTRSIPTLKWTYDKPGEYTITIVAEDTIGCTDTTQLTVYVSEVTPDFDFGDQIINCASIVSFNDLSTFIDPCADKDTCTNGTDLSCEKIISWSWDFGDGTRKSLLQNPSHNYTTGGTFEVTLVVETELGCIDTIRKSLYIPGPQPEFGFVNKVDRDRDSAIICAGESVEVINFGQGDVNTPTFQFIWGDDSNDPPGAIGDTFSHVYTTPGTYKLYIIQEDEVPGGGRCSRIFPDTSDDIINKREIVVVVNPTPEVTITADPLIVCPDELITFTADMDARYTRISWIMGDGDTINEPDANKNTLSYSYDQPGIYEIILAPEYDELPRCWDTDTIQVEVQTVTASFTIDSSARPEFCFTNTSTGATSYSWTFEDEPVPGASTEENPCYNWDDRKGMWEVCLTAVNDRGCEDEVCEIIGNTFIRTLKPYNVFSPNDDQYNNTFVIEGESIAEYNIKIFNRWGERVFETEDINVSWNGKVNNTGVECPSGTYFYIINYTFEFGEENEGKGPIEGQVELIR